jgi:hypothetical protein
MEVSYNLEVQSKDYPGKLSIYSSRFYSSPILIGPLSTRPPLLSGHSQQGHPSYQATLNKVTRLIRPLSTRPSLLSGHSQQGHPSYQATLNKTTPLIRPLSTRPSLLSPESGLIRGMVLLRVA